jgi:hypothetical protein
MSCSRSNPSPRYVQLQDLYCTMHQEGEKFLGIQPASGRSIQRRHRDGRARALPGSGHALDRGRDFGFARRFVFANVACYPVNKRLPNGENAHCTIKPVAWWREVVCATAARHPGIEREFWIQWREDSPQGARLREGQVGGR